MIYTLGRSFKWEENSISTSLWNATEWLILFLEPVLLWIYTNWTPFLFISLIEWNTYQAEITVSFRLLSRLWRNLKRAEMNGSLQHWSTLVWFIFLSVKDLPSGYFITSLCSVDHFVSNRFCSIFIGIWMGTCDVFCWPDLSRNFDDPSSTFENIAYRSILYNIICDRSHIT